MLFARLGSGGSLFHGQPGVLAQSAPTSSAFFVGTYTRFMPVFAKDVLNVGPDGLGLTGRRRSECSHSSFLAHWKSAGAAKR